MGEEPSTGDGAGTSTAQNGVERATNVTIATGSETHDIDVEEALTLLIKNTFEDSSPHPPQNNETGGELSDVAPKTPTKPIPSTEGASPASSRKYRVMFENMRARCMEVTKVCDAQKEKYESIIAQKDETINQS